MSTYPVSPMQLTSGVMWFPRMLDKIRLHARGELGQDYHANLGERMDKHCTAFLRIEYAALRDRVLAGGSDEDLLAWCFEKGRPLHEVDLLVWNAFVSKRGWNDDASPRLAEMKAKFGAADRSDIVTIPQFMDLDEGRIS
ncbi:MAG TPA: DUF5069 domain-containing protein [Chthoniobacterales bacterium]|nr:DUF5069 domain-containing protein [Chthoniobacterales bacterium]